MNPFSLLGDLGLYAKLAVAGALVAALVGVYFAIHHDGVVEGRDEVHVQWAGDRAAQAVAESKAVMQRIADNAALRTQYEIKHQQEVDHHEKELADNRAIEQRNAGRRVPISAELCRQGLAGAPKTAGTSGTQQGLAPTGLLPDRTGIDSGQLGGPFYLPQQVTDRLRKMVALADGITADARSVQAEVKSAGCF